MKHFAWFFTLGIVLLMSLGMVSVSANWGVETSHNINISSMDEKFSISETSTVLLESELNQLSFYEVWIPSDASDVKVKIENHILQSELQESNIYRCNLTAFNNSSLTLINVDVSYFLPITTNEFITTLIRNVTQVNIRFDDEVIGTFTSLRNGSKLALPFHITEEESLFNVYYIIFFILLVIVIITSILYVIKKKKTVQHRVRSLESEDVLKTEYDLLKDMLKQIEKYHRSEKISDETYHKLKEHYKQQAIETMVELEKRGSKIDG